MIGVTMTAIVVEAWSALSFVVEAVLFANSCECEVNVVWRREVK